MNIVSLEQRDGIWHAIITLPTPPDGETYHLDRRYGSWRVTPERPGSGHRDVLPEVAAALQRRVRAEERHAARTSIGA